MKKQRNSRSVTLIEVLIAVVLLSLVVIGFSSIDSFTRHHVITSDRRAKSQNEASLVLEHATKHMSKAVGNEIANGSGTVIYNNAGLDIWSYHIDTNKDGIADNWEAYRYYDASGAPAYRYDVQYCPDCQNNRNCGACNPAWGTQENIIATNISSFNLTKPVNASGQLNQGYVELEVIGCWDPTEARYPCGDTNNPSVELKTRVNLPSVSTN